MVLFTRNIPCSELIRHLGQVEVPNSGLGVGKETLCVSFLHLIAFLVIISVYTVNIRVPPLCIKPCFTHSVQLSVATSCPLQRSGWRRNHNRCLSYTSNLNTPQSQSWFTRVDKHRGLKRRHTALGLDSRSSDDTHVHYPKLTFSIFQLMEILLLEMCSSLGLIFILKYTP